MEGEHRGEGLSGLFPFFSLLPIILHCPYHPIFIAHKGDQMSSTAMKIALTFTAIDAASATIGTLGRHLGSLGEAGKRAQKDFDSMTRSMTEGLKGLTATWLAFEKLKPVISIAAGMQESMTKLEISLARSGQNAAVFNAELEKMRDAAWQTSGALPVRTKGDDRGRDRACSVRNEGRRHLFAYRRPDSRSGHWRASVISRQSRRRRLSRN